ncbi:MAG TPA: methyltransferase [Verrucomicrobiae bacterium]|nr:methyltransferase [Verrucomicrobiae bacterium]
MTKKPADIKATVPEPFFKGWAKPGPIPPGALDENLVVPDGETLDAISGYFRLYQLRNGHRFSTDDVLTAWYGTTWCPSARTVLDLGSGIGSVGMIAAWRQPGARFVTVEAQARSVELAQKSAAYNGLDERYEIRLGDFRDAGALRADEKFDLVLGSPPYFPVGTGIEGDHPQKIACRFELRGDIADYCRAAAAHLAVGGFFACVFPNEQIERVQKSAHKVGLAIVRRRTVVLKEGEAPLLCLFGMMLADHLPEGFRSQTWDEPSLIIRRKDGSVHPEYSAVKLAIGFPP